MKRRKPADTLPLPQRRSPQELDDNILAYARKHAPHRRSFTPGAWMGTLAAAGIAGVALLIALPQQTQQFADDAVRDEPVSAALRIEDALAPPELRTDAPLSEAVSVQSPAVVAARAQEQHLHDASNSSLPAVQAKATLQGPHRDSAARAGASQATRHAAQDNVDTEVPAGSPLGTRAQRSPSAAALMLAESFEADAASLGIKPLQSNMDPNAHASLAAPGDAESSDPAPAAKKSAPSSGARHSTPTDAKTDIQRALQACRPFLPARPAAPGEAAQQCYQVFKSACEDCALPQTLEQALEQALEHEIADPAPVSTQR